MSLWSLIAEDFRSIRERDPAAGGAWETALCYPGLHAVTIHRFSHRLWSRGWRLLPRMMSYIGRALTNIDIHPGASIGPAFFIDHGACVVIGETAEIGAGCTLYHGVTLGGVSWSPGKRHPSLADGVMIGAGAKILGPVYLGENVRVGANSVVVENVPDGCTVVGIPARIVQTEAKSHRDPLRIDLNHHLIPDPVGRSLAKLADRIGFLEARLAAHQAKDAAEEATASKALAPNKTTQTPENAKTRDLCHH
ncbi:MAG: serine O-acetyltransferase [Mangrovicoccus sp.]